VVVALRDQRIVVERIMFAMAKNSLQDLTCHGIKALSHIFTAFPSSFILREFSQLPYFGTPVISQLPSFGLPTPVALHGY